MKKPYFVVNGGFATGILNFVQVRKTLFIFIFVSVNTAFGISGSIIGVIYVNSLQR